MVALQPRLALGWMLVLAAVLAVPSVAHAKSDAADFLYRMAKEYRQAGRTDDAEHELRKLLILDPDHEDAKQELAAIEQERASRARVMEEATQRLMDARQKAREAAMEEALRHAQPLTPASAPGPTPAPTTTQAPAPAAPVAVAPTPSAPTPAPEKRSLKERMGLPSIPPFGLVQVLTPPEETRPEILTETKRAGFQKFYKEGIGLQPVPGFGVSTRTEIFDEPDPVDDAILNSKILHFSQVSQFRNFLHPLFTRAWAVRMVADKEPLPRLTYEYDDRTVFHEFETRFGFKDRHLQTHAVNALYSLPRVPLLGVLTLNPWYKHVLQDSQHDLGTYEHRNELVFNMSLRPNDDLEYFFQFDGYQADKTRTVGGSKLKLYQGQVRMRFPRLKLFVIPSFEYSDTGFDPGDDQFTKRDFFVDWGFDITKRLRASSKQEWVYSKLSQSTSIPTNPDAQAFNTTNTLSYELFKDFDVSFGLDYSKGLGYSKFNNVGLRAEMEFFKPGILRAKFGYEWLTYYNIQDDLSLLYLRVFLFQ